MNKNEIVKIDVMFRKYKDSGDILAVFPHDIADFKYNVTCYERVGQHGAGDYNACLDLTVPALPNEYRALQRELISIGYDLNIVKRRNYKKYLNEVAIMAS